MKAYGYVRQSTNEQYNSIPDQKREILNFAKKNNIDIICFYEDIDTGKNEARKGFKSMLEAVNKNQVDAVLVYAMNRWGRFKNPKKSLFYEVMVNDAGAKVIYTTESVEDDGTTGNIITRQLKASEATEYIRNLSKVVLRGLSTIAKKGYSTGRRAPYGYDRVLFDTNGNPLFLFKVDREKNLIKTDLNGKVLEIIPAIYKKSKSGNTRKSTEKIPKTNSQHVGFILGDKREIEIVKFILETYANTSKGLRAIVSILNNPNSEWYVPSPNNGLWSIEMIRQVITNPIYAGILAYNRFNRSEFHRLEIEDGAINIQGKSILGNDKKTVSNPEDQWIKVQMPELSIVSKETYRANQMKLAKRRANQNQHLIHSHYLLSSKIKCMECQGRMSGKTEKKSRNGRDERRYICNNYVQKGNAGCSRNVVETRLLDNYVLKIVEEELKELEDNKELKERIKALLKQEHPENQNNGMELVRKLKETRNMIENAVEKLILVSKEHLPLIEKKLEKLKDEEKHIINQINKTKAMNSYSKKDMVNKVARKVRDIKGILERAEYSEVKSLIQDMVEHVHLWFEDSNKKRPKTILKRGEICLNSLVEDTVNQTLTESANSEEVSMASTTECPLPRLRGCALFRGWTGLCP